MSALAIGRRFDICRLAELGRYEECRNLISNSPGTPWRRFLAEQHIRALDALPALPVAHSEPAAHKKRKRAA